jgi:hypothetical protein
MTRLEAESRLAGHMRMSLVVFRAIVESIAKWTGAEGIVMPCYALQMAYAPLAWASLLGTAEPPAGSEARRRRLGGSIVNGWFSFGSTTCW